MIESINNERVKNWCKLKEKKYRDSTNKFLIEGDHLLNEAMKKGIVKEIIALDDFFKIGNITFYKVSVPVMKKISSQVTIPKVIAVCEKISSRDVLGNVCILDCIQDPGNLGTIIRSAVAFNIDTIIMSPDTVDLYNEKVIRATEGMIFNMNFIRNDLSEEIKKLKANGYTIYGTDVRNGKNLKEIAFSKNNAIIIGNEGQGMSSYLEDLCDSNIYIPINSCESLNASVAASIIFYEMNGEIKNGV